MKNRGSKRIQLRAVQKFKTLQRGTLAIAGASILGLAAYYTFFINTADVSTSRAGNMMFEQDPVNNGEVILAYSWEKMKPLVSDEGIPGMSNSQGLECVPGGVKNSFGISAGNMASGIDLIPGQQDLIKGNGIDFSIDFRRKESDGEFFNCGKSIMLSLKKGKLFIQYSTKGPKGESNEINEKTKYEVPEDDQFRNIRFVFDPSNGRGEILVDQVTVWAHQGDAGQSLVWEKDHPVMIGKDMNADGSAVAIFDNLLFRGINKNAGLPLQLLSFTAELQTEKVQLTWFTGSENGTTEFVIEKSFDTKEYFQVGKIKAAGKSQKLKAYVLYDTNPSPGVCYYRMRLSETDVHTVWVPVIAIRLKPEMLSATPNLSSSQIEEKVKGSN